jgi:hypothetical protein
VVRSDFASFLGLPVELWGIGYYALILLSYATFLIWPAAATGTAIFLLLGLSTAAFLFSLYLTFIQAFTLRQWCSWCLVSAALCLLIFSLSWYAAALPLATMLADHAHLLLVAHIIGVSLGVGGTTLADVFFFKFLKDLKISQEENAVLQTISQVIWFALAVLILTGLGLYLPKAEVLNASPKFLAKMIMVVVIIVNGSLLNLVVAPKLTRISFHKRHSHERGLSRRPLRRIEARAKAGELHHLRRLAFAFGAISLTSWYSTLIVALARVEWPLSYWLWAYGLILTLAVFASQVTERLISNRQLD